jgi:hypothetical protein
MTSCTVTTGSSDFPSKALLTCTICSKYKSQENAHNHKKMLFYFLHNKILYTETGYIRYKYLNWNYTIPHTWILCTKLQHSSSSNIPLSLYSKNKTYPALVNWNTTGLYCKQYNH